MQRGQKITLSNVFVFKTKTFDNVIFWPLCMLFSIGKQKFSTLVRNYVSSDYTLANLIENVELSAFQYQLTTYRWKLLFFWMFFIFLQNRDKGYGKSVHTSKRHLSTSF